MRRWLFAGFFLFMLACTGISRIYDSITVPKVVTAAAKRKTVETCVEGSGTVKVKEKEIYPVFAGLRLAQVRELGSEVKAGDVLFGFTLESIEEKREALVGELQQLEIAIAKEQTAQASYRGMRQVELAQWELSLAERELAEGINAWEEEKESHQNELERLAKEYEDGLARLNDDLWQQQDRDWERAKQAMDNAKSSRDREVRAAQRQIEALIEELDQLEEAEEGSERRKLEQELAGAREDLEALRASWKEQMDSLEAQMEILEDQEERIHAGRTEAQESRKQSYEDAVRQEEEKWKNLQKGQRSLEKAVEEAEWKLLTAQRQDDAELLLQVQKQQISELTIRGMELEKKEKYRQINRLDKLLAEGGQVLAREDGVVTDQELTAGKTASGEEIVALAVGENQFEAAFLKEEQQLSQGDRIEIAVPGTRKTKEATIGRINLLGETEGIFQADLGDLELDLGSVATYRCIKQSELFARVIPLEGLRKDMKGYYCLVARSRSSILGEEFRAERVNLQLLYQGSTEAAVEGSLFEEDEVIVGENQSIGEGDRVRVVKGF